MTVIAPELKERDMLPKTAAVSLCVQWKRCGKPNCRCAAGNPHGPYWYLFWREDGRLTKRYVRRDDVAVVRGTLAEHRQRRWLHREEHRRSLSVWREHVEGVRECERRLPAR